MLFYIFKRYMYNGIINIDDLDANEILELLEACDELCFDELIDDLQNFLIKEEKECIQENLIDIYKFSSQYQPFNLLQDYCDGLFYDNAELLLKSCDIAIIKKPMFILILKNDDLELREIDIWDCVIRWGVGQIENLVQLKRIEEIESGQLLPKFKKQKIKLEKENILEWNNDYLKELKDILVDIIPLIRFNQITPTEFHKEIEPYKKIIDKGLYEEITQIHHNDINNNWQSRLLLQRCTRIKEGKLLNSRMKYLISGWIDLKKYNYKEDELPYEFQLILQGTKDGYARTIFEQKCYNIEQTIVMMKIKETGELVGGYNPVCWNKKERSSNDSYWIETDKSFIFKIDENQLDNSILSRVKKPKYAIHHPRPNIDFTCNYIRFLEITIDFNILALCISVKNEPYCYYEHDAPDYENNLKLRNGNKIVHLL